MANLFKEKPVVKVVMLKGQDGQDGEEKLINQADGSELSFWIGTKAEFDAIPEEELIHNCVYYITDDTRDDFNTRLNELDTKVDNNAIAINNLEPTTIEVTDFEEGFAATPTYPLVIRKVGNVINIRGLFYATDQHTFIPANGNLLACNIGMELPISVRVYFPDWYKKDISHYIVIDTSGDLTIINGSDQAWEISSFYINETLIL